MKYKLAIDFGMTNSVVVLWEAESPRVIDVPGLSHPQIGDRLPLVPSLLYVENGLSGDVVIGQAVEKIPPERLESKRLFRNFKRSILSRTDREPRLIDGTPWSDHDAGKHFLKVLMNRIPFPAEEIEQLVLTAPVGAFENYLAWLSCETGSMSADRVRLVDESTAAALGYSVTEPGQIILVFDFGGGSLDISLVQLPESRQKTVGLLGNLRLGGHRDHRARVISKTGISLGGSDIDHWLLAGVLERIGVKPETFNMDISLLLSACEAVKVKLSNSEIAQLQFPIGSQRYDLPIQRSELETLLGERGFYDNILMAIEKVMRRAHREGVFGEDVRDILMTGGTSLVPSVQALLKQCFGDSPVHVDKPFTAVVEGALQVAAGFGLDDYLSHSYGLRYLNPMTGEHSYDEVIPMGSRYPMEKPVEVLLGAAHKDQQAVEFVIGEIELQAVSSIEVEFEGGQTVFVAQAEPDEQIIRPLNLSDAERRLAGLEPPGVLGETRLLARFFVDEMRRLRLSVLDLVSQKEIMRDVPLIVLGDFEAVDQGENAARGCEPSIIAQRRKTEQRLSLRRLGTLLNMLPPHALSVEAAREAIKSDAFYVRYEAADLLSRRSDREARLVVEEFLKEGTAPQRAAVARHLFRFSWFAAKPLLKKALDDRDWRVRESAVYALCQLRERGAYKLLLEVLPGEGDRIKEAAVWGLSRNPDPGSLSVLEITLGAQDPEIRVQALEVIAAIQSPDGVPMVQLMLEDPDPDVKYAAALSWMELTGTDCLPDLVAAILASNGEDRLALVRGLFHASNYLFINLAESQAAGEILEAMKTVLQDDLIETRLTAVKTLACMLDGRAAALLREAYHQEADPELQARMVYYVASLASPARDDLLRDAMQHPDPGVRQTAERYAGLK